MHWEATLADKKETGTLTAQSSVGSQTLAGLKLRSILQRHLEVYSQVNKPWGISIAAYRVRRMS